jgi:hypothetical protein
MFRPYARIIIIFVQNGRQKGKSEYRDTAIVVKVKQSLETPWVLQEVEAPSFQDSRHIYVVNLSVLGTSRLYPPENIPGTHFC